MAITLASVITTSRKSTTSAGRSVSAMRRQRRWMMTSASIATTYGAMKSSQTIHVAVDMSRRTFLWRSKIDRISVER
jgi:hypothetical protein